MAKPEPTHEQTLALIAFAERNGRNWKQALRDACPGGFVVRF